jgi:dCTP deaminase
MNMNKKINELIKEQEELKRQLADLRTEIETFGEQTKLALLAGEEIRRHIETRELIIEPILDWEKQVTEEPVSVSLRLDNYFGEFRTAKKEFIDLKEPGAEHVEFREIEFKEGYVIHPGKLVLAQSFEWVALPSRLVGVLDGRSSLGRFGLVVHATAGWVDPGFRGHLVFELINLGEMPVKLYPLVRIARLALFKVKETTNYKGRFNFQIKPRIPTRADPDLVDIHKHLARNS